MDVLGFLVATASGEGWGVNVVYQSLGSVALSRRTFVPAQGPDASLRVLV